MEKINLLPILDTSIAIAVAACLLGLLAIFPGMFGIQSALYFGKFIGLEALTSLILSIVWIILLVVAIYFHKLKGLWVLVGFPFIAVVPCLLTVIAFGCGHGKCP